MIVQLTNLFCIIKEYMEKDDRVKLVNNETNQKLPKSLNIDLNIAEGLLYMDIG